MDQERYNPKMFSILFFLSLVCFSCSPPALEKEAPAVNEIRLGTKFRVNLPEDHTSGYSWQLNQEFDNSVTEHLNAVWHGQEKGIDFNFNAIAVGQTTLSFVERKYRDTSRIRTFVVKIVPK